MALDRAQPDEEFSSDLGWPGAAAPSSPPRVGAAIAFGLSNLRGRQ
jgi:hypothetical protein